MNEMVERVKRGIADGPVPHNRFNFRALMSACCVIVDGPSVVADLPRAADFLLEAIARAAIAAMREPSDAMRAAGERAALADGAHDCEVPMADVWRAMIDAALRDA